jgi:hypothetical protein
VLKSPLDQKPVKSASGNVRLCHSTLEDNHRFGDRIFWPEPIIVHKTRAGVISLLTTQAKTHVLLGSSYIFLARVP